MPNIPQPEEVMPELSSVLKVIHTAIEHGTMRASEFFDEKDVEIDRFLAPCLVRYFAKKYLESEGHEVSAETESDFNLQPLPNNGLCLQHGRYRMRILKSDNGDPPVPGHSISRQGFYQQLPLLLATSEGIEVQEEILNLIVLWEIARPYTLSSLCLVCPKNGKDTKASVEIHWQVPIQHPALTINADANTNQDTEGDLLPMKLKNREIKAEEG